MSDWIAWKGGRWRNPKPELEVKTTGDRWDDLGPMQPPQTAAKGER
jgi:hypothetical protein